MAVKFQLIFNGDLDDSINPTEIMPEFADILDIGIEFVGTYFPVKGKQATLFESTDFKTTQSVQRRLENIGVYCDIKPIDDAVNNDPEPEPEIKNPTPIKKPSSSNYKSVFKTPDLEEHQEFNLEKDIEFSDEDIVIDSDSSIIEDSSNSEQKKEDGLIEFEDVWKEPKD